MDVIPTGLLADTPFDLPSMDSSMWLWAGIVAGVLVVGAVIFAVVASKRRSGDGSGDEQR